MKVIEISHEVKFPRPEQIPTSGGIYGWFYNFKNLFSHIENKDMFTAELERISKALSYPPLKGELQGPLGVVFSVYMENIDYLKKSEIEKKVKNLDSESFKIFFQILNEFSLPLYVGISKNLKRRYEGHIRSYIDAKKANSISVKSFGERLNSMNIEPRELIFKYYLVEKNNKARQSIEFILNRLFKPYGGKK